ncbi:MAG: hypothetical protein AAFV43_13125 [Planctomycetota bacterium]
MNDTRFDIRVVKPLARATCGLLVIFALGCGNQFGATVSGRVLLDGEPVPDGRLAFVRVGSTKSPAIGPIKPDGRYTLLTKSQPGAEPGDYQVAVQSFKPIEGLKPGERSFETPEPLVPQRYLSVKTSGLLYTVEPGSNTIDIELTSDENAG